MIISRSPLRITLGGGGTDLPTVSKDIINKLELINFNLEDYSLDTVKTFYKDASQANFKI